MDNENFVVVKVKRCYEFLEGVDFIQSFQTKQEAIQYIQTKRDAYYESCAKRLKAVDQYVEGLTFPSTSKIQEWQDFLKPFYPFSIGIWHTSVADIKRSLISYLNNNAIKDFKLPELEEHAEDCFVVEIKAKNE